MATLPLEKTYITGGNLPPEQVKTYTTGGNQPPTPVTANMTTGGNLPPTPVNTGGVPYVGQGQNLGQISLSNPNALGMVQGAMAGILDPNGQYIQNARQYGLDHARSRGLLNSSIAAGNSQRAAIGAAMPLAQEVLGIQNRRENEQFQRLFQREGADLGRRNSLDVAAANANLTNWLADNTHVRSLASASHTAGLQDWMANQAFTRNFNGALAMLPISNAFELNRMIADYALSDPETYPQNVVSGLTNFLNQNMFSILKQYFPNLVIGGGS